MLWLPLYLLQYDKTDRNVYFNDDITNRQDLQDLCRQYSGGQMRIRFADRGGRKRDVMGRSLGSRQYTQCVWTKPL